MKFCSKGTLTDSKKRSGQLFTEKEILNIFSQIVFGLNYIHGQSFLHRDIKPDNIFFAEDGTVKIGDLGLSRPVDPDNPVAPTPCGTKLFMSPEIQQEMEYTFSSDIWSLGVTLYFMLMLEAPWDMPNVIRHIGGDVTVVPPKQIVNPYSPDLQEICLRMLEPLPENRITFPQIVEALKTKFGICEFPTQPEEIFHHAKTLENADPLAAFCVYKMAADLNYYEAIVQVVASYEKGIGIPKNLDMYRKYAELASQSERGRGHWLYARALEYGWGGPIDLTLAREYYKRSTEKCFIYGIVRYGYFLENGIGGEVNLPMASRVFKFGCPTNYSDCLYKYGVSLEKGYDGPIDLRAALNFYKKAMDMDSKHPFAGDAYRRLVAAGVQRSVV